MTHCRTCAPCAAFAVALDGLPLAALFVDDAPDLTASVLTATAGSAPRVDDDVLVWRWGLVFVALALVLAAVVHVGGEHAARDQAAWEAALAAGFAWAAWKPWRASGLLPMASVLSMLLVVNGGASAGAGGVHHLLAPLGTVLLALATRHRPAPRPLTA